MRKEGIYYTAYFVFEQRIFFLPFFCQVVYTIVSRATGLENFNFGETIMKKTPLVFIFDYDQQILTNQVKAGSEWVFEGKAVATIKFDGTATLWQDGKLWKRFDRKLSPAGQKFIQNNPGAKPELSHFRQAPEGFMPCEEQPDAKTFHWPGWVPVSEDKPEDKHFIQALKKAQNLQEGATYELVGPAFASNPYKLTEHELWRHGSEKALLTDVSFEGICKFLRENVVEGIVFHNIEDGRVAKIRRKDFLLQADRYLHWQDMTPEQLQDVSKQKLKP